MTVPLLHLSCRTADEAGHIISLLLSRNVKPKDIEVLSAEPLHELGETISGKSRLPAFVLAGAALGIVAGWSMAALTARLYPLNTGGMPVVAALPAGIVTRATKAIAKGPSEDSTAPCGHSSIRGCGSSPRLRAFASERCPVRARARCSLPKDTRRSRFKASPVRRR